MEKREEICGCLGKVFEEALSSRLVDMKIEALSPEEVYSETKSHCEILKRMPSASQLEEYHNKPIEVLYQVLFFAIVAAKRNFCLFRKIKYPHSSPFSSEHLTKIICYAVNEYTQYRLIWYTKKVSGNSYRTAQCFGVIKNPDFILSGTIKETDICNLLKRKGMYWKDVADRDPNYVLWVYDNLDFVDLEYKIVKRASENILYGKNLKKKDIQIERYLRKVDKV